jgi:hypothetical protein
MDKTINVMKELVSNKEKYLSMVNSNNLKNNILERTIETIAKDIRSLLDKRSWKLDKIYCVNNPNFEPERYEMLSNMFSKYNINPDYVEYISPTYKHTIDVDTYNKYTINQYVKRLRNYPLTYGELSLFLNYRAVLEHIERNFKSGFFLVCESDAMPGKDIEQLSEFVEFVKDKDFDLIHIGTFAPEIYQHPLDPYRFLTTGYRNNIITNQYKFVQYIIDYINNNNQILIEDITNKNDKYRLCRRFHTKCTETFIWKYDAVCKFLNFMRSFEDYSSPFDYYMCNFFENNIDFKHYWAVNEFFIQGSNLKIIPSTLDRK